MITLDRVGVQYERSMAVAEVSLVVDRGSWLAVVGPNGAGKSTLLSCMAHLVGHEGEVRLDGRAVQAMSRRELARLVAYVPQRPVFPADMPVRDYVLLGRTPYLGYLRGETAHDLAVCGELIDRLRLTPLAGRRLATLSGGELQRLVLARALAQQAPVLLMDEPTSALDLGRRVDALELVDELRHERNLTVVSAVHDLTLAGQFADVLALMNQGRVVASGPPGEVLRPDLLAATFGVGVDVIEHGGELVVVSSRTPGLGGTDRRAGPA